jgi:hypothetical protein
MNLFARILREASEDTIHKLSQEYEKLGLFTNTAESHNETALDVSDTEDFEYYWKDNHHTGMFIRFTGPNSAHVNTIVIAARDRGKGLAEKLIRLLIDTCDIDSLEIADYSDGFWKHIETKFPDVKFTYEDIG